MMKFQTVSYLVLVKANLSFVRFNSLDEILLERNQGVINIFIAGFTVVVFHSDMRVTILNCQLLKCS